MAIGSRRGRKDMANFFFGDSNLILSMLAFLKKSPHYFLSVEEIIQEFALAL